MAHDALEKLKRLLGYATAAERAELAAIARQLTPAWVPLFQGPQQAAYDSPADVLFYGGAAGGGKTDLVIGAALTRHRRSIIFRKVGTELQAIIDRMAEILGTAEGYNAQKNVWRLSGRQVEFGAVPVPGDEKKYQGRPHDLKVFDEITSFPEAQFRFLVTWLRTTAKAQRCRVICTGNPPVDSQGEWVVRYWAPWLDKDHPNPAQPGELRWFAVLDGKDVELDSGEPFCHAGTEIRPQSRTFIPSRVRDNPFLMETGYEATLQALPEPLRSQMLEGDFTAGRDENPFQVIPTAWVTAAQGRWREEGRQGPMDAVGQDVARGGRAETVVARRHGAWYDQLLCYPGSVTPDGPSAAAVALSAVRDGAPIHVDVIGCGTSPYDHLNRAGVHVVAINGAAASYGTDHSGKLRFYNLRAELWWKLREALDPAAVPPVALPPGQALRADLCAPTWSLRAGRILIESKEDLMARIGRSPDKGDAIVYASVETPKRAALAGRAGHVVEYDPWV
ncbi:terminase [Geobacter sp. FeAm09]|uniref:terminase family protein n=1 Tax=Geobacter sp. FeAm09 TaxID=2597769 RepID=UPI0011EF3A52|nr:terminase family protein [Geobacter sp. FeAm09]QEM67533.1 terminase [Geobacter sp. FeAm09]